jgi:Spy/CpxP family protein refolding chaperone
MASQPGVTLLSEPTLARFAPMIQVRRTILLAAILLAAAIPAGAGQSLKFKWWQHEHFISELRLTPEQSDRIEQVFQASWPALKGAKHDLDRLETELSHLIAEGTASETKVLKQIDRVEASRSVMGRTRSLMLYRMHQVLTPEQRSRLKELNEAKERESAKRGSHQPK